MVTAEKERRQADLHSLARQVLKQIRHNETVIHRSQDIWVLYGDKLEGYERTFAAVLEGGNILEFIKQRHSPIILDLMAPSATLRDFFKEIPDKSKLGIALSLLDKRTIKETNEDKKLDIKQLTGNIMHGGSWRKIKNELRGRKADLIIERAAGGLDCLPINEVLYSILLNKAWGLLSGDNGMLLVQVLPSVDLQQNSVRIEKWINLLKESNLNVIYEDNKHGDTDSRFWDKGVLKIVKTPNSPEKLPFLK